MSRPSAGSRTWLHEWPNPNDPQPLHTATLLIDDVPVAKGQGASWFSAAMNLHAALREQGIPPDGNVLAFAAFSAQTTIGKAWQSS